jgi:hypothetical protein
MLTPKAPTWLFLNNVVANLERIAMHKFKGLTMKIQLAKDG